MKTLTIFASWVLGTVMTAVFPAVVLALVTPLTYNDVMTSPAYCAITFLLGSCGIGVMVADEVKERLD
jgi:hypothetical protein